MKKLVAISFLFIYLFSTTEFYQLLKTPLLIEHFMKHREEKNDITLWQFLYIHYAKSDVKAADDDKDMELPFKSHSSSLSTISSFYVYLPESFSLRPFKQNVEERTFAIKNGILLSSFLSSIWQPPRLF